VSLLFQSTMLSPGRISVDDFPPALSIVLTSYELRY
jgi:hypothetical protein